MRLAQFFENVNLHFYQHFFIFSTITTVPRVTACWPSIRVALDRLGKLNTTVIYNESVSGESKNISSEIKNFTEIVENFPEIDETEIMATNNNGSNKAVNDANVSKTTRLTSQPGNDMDNNEVVANIATNLVTNYANSNVTISKHHEERNTTMN